MHITFSPVEGSQEFEANVDGDVIVVNGQSFDFGPLKAGQRLPVSAIDSPYFLGPVTRLDSGDIQLTLRSPFTFGDSDNVAYPNPVHITKGAVVFPISTNVVEEVQYVASAPIESFDTTEVLND